MEVAIPTWVIASATIVAAFAALFGNEYTRAFVKRFYKRLSILPHYMFTILRIRSHWLIRIGLAVICIMWIPLVAIELWANLRMHSEDQVVLITSILIGSATTASAVVLLTRLKNTKKKKPPVQKPYEEPSWTHTRYNNSTQVMSVGMLAIDVAIEMSDNISIIDGMTEILLSNADTHLKTTEAKEYMEAISDASKMIARANRAILNYHRADEPAYEFDLNQLCGDVLAIMVYRLRACGIKVEKRYTEGLLVLSGCRSRLGQVLVSLISSVADTMIIGGIVTLETLRCDREAKVIISDNSFGTSSRYLGNNTKRFLDLKPARNDIALDLDVARMRLVNSGSRIEARNTASKGTSIIISIPFEGANERQNTSG